MTPISDDMVERGVAALNAAGQRNAYNHVLVRIALTAALEGSVAVPAWQPIETAPKDGTWVLVWEDTGVNTKFSCADVARYYLGDWQNGEKCRVHHASHWQPLPAPPITRQDRGGEA